MVKEINILIKGSELPHTIGRYTIARLIEKGSMGLFTKGWTLTSNAWCS
jgi:hypothetical protein